MALGARSFARHRSANQLLAALALALASGCAGSEPFVAEPEPIGPDCTIEGTERFFPLAEGASWTFRVTRLNNGEQVDKTQTVGPLEDVGGEKAGIMAYRVTTQKALGETVTYQEDTGTAIHRHLEQDRAGNTFHDEYFVEYKLRIDEAPEHIVEGAAWTETHEERSTVVLADGTITGPPEVVSRTENWSVERGGEEVTVGAGTFCAMQVRRITTIAGVEASDKQYWFVRGVGKVKERSNNRREELVGFSLP